VSENDRVKKFVSECGEGGEKKNPVPNNIKGSKKRGEGGQREDSRNSKNEVKIIGCLQGSLCNWGGGKGEGGSSGNAEEGGGQHLMCAQ